jgi:hypothetical protein
LLKKVQHQGIAELGRQVLLRKVQYEAGGDSANDDKNETQAFTYPFEKV